MASLLPGPILLTGLDGPLARAIARRLAADCPALVVAAPTLAVAQEAAAEADAIARARGCAGGAHAVEADPAVAGRAAALLDAARAAVGAPAAIVICKRVDVASGGDGAPTLVIDSFDHVLAAVAELAPEHRPRAVVLAARAFPPLDAADALAALAAVVDARAGALGDTALHVFATVDPHYGAMASAFGLMDRPFGADVEVARRRLEKAADEVHGLLATPGATVRG